MEKLTKQDIKGPDAFQSTVEIFSEFFFEHRMTIIGAVAVVFVGGVIWAATGMYFSSVEEKAQESLFVAEKKLDSTKEAFDKAKTAAAEKPVEKDKKNLKKTDPIIPETPLVKETGNLDTDYKDSVNLLQGVIAAYPKTQAGVFAALDLTHLYYDHKMFDQEVPLLEHAAKVADHPVTKGFTLNQLAMAYEGKGDCGKAIDTWQQIENNPHLSFLAGETLISMGLCYEKLHQNDKAEQTYMKAEGLVKDGDVPKTAKKYLRLLKREQKS